MCVGFGLDCVCILIQPAQRSFASAFTSISLVPVLSTFVLTTLLQHTNDFFSRPKSCGPSTHTALRMHCCYLACSRMLVSPPRGEKPHRQVHSLHAPPVFGGNLRKNGRICCRLIECAYHCQHFLPAISFFGPPTKQEDVSRKKTDEMKKRAIHTAASYDEFRHMVSCAQLTPVT